MIADNENLSLSIEPYTLPDACLLKTHKLPSAVIWRPDEVYIILGRSNSLEKSLFTQHVIDDNVRIMKRPSGGEAVVLTPLMIVVAMAWPIEVSNSSQVAFKLSNELIISTLTQLGVRNLHHKGISDISINDRKIAGSAMHKGSDRWFYHAVVNVAEPIGTISWYLVHPNREPDYRQGRSHEDFVTNLFEQGYKIDIQDLVNALVKNLKAPGLIVEE